MTAVDLAGYSDSSAQRWRPRARGPRYLLDPETESPLTIEERPADGVAGARGATYLIVFFEQGFHRLWRFPANWEQLSDDELLRLTWRPRRAG